jgi:hypothetical protein
MNARVTALFPRSWNHDAFHAVIQAHASKESQMTDKWKNQGEGDKESARKYNEKAEEFAKSGKVEEAARDAKEALSGDEREELLKAEKDGKSHAKH